MISNASFVHACNVELSLKNDYLEIKQFELYANKLENSMTSKYEHNTHP